jgi:hypothetical protein
MTRDQIIETMARAIRDDGGCGFTIDGGTTFCDDLRAPDDLRQDECGCKSQATAALSAVEDGACVVPNAENMTDLQAEAIALRAGVCGGIAFDIYDAALKASPFRSTP